MAHQHKKVGNEFRKGKDEQSSPSEFKGALQKAKKKDESSHSNKDGGNKHLAMAKDPEKKEVESEQTQKSDSKNFSKPITNKSISKYLSESGDKGDLDTKEFPKLQSLSKVKPKKDEKKDVTLPAEMVVTPPIYKDACEKIENVQNIVPVKIRPLITQMVSSIMVMTQKGVTTATVTLSSEAFKDSPFEGIEIKFTCFDTASNSFNIEISGTAEQTALLNQNIPILAKILKDKQMPFEVGRIETSKKSDFLFKRKESAGNKGEDKP